MQARLDEVKVELQVVMGHWRQEWKDAVNKWSDKITIYPSGPTFDVVKLPTDYLDGLILLEWDRETSLPSVKVVRYIGYASFYYWHSLVHLGNLPINLFVSIYLHLVVAFGGTFSKHETVNRSTTIQWFWLDDKHKRHRQIIEQSLSRISQPDDQINDDWLRVVSDETASTDKLRPEHYAKEVVNNLVNHQVAKMIEHHFRSSQQAEKITKVAKRFSQLLVTPSQGAVKIVAGADYIPLLNSFITKDGDDADSYSLQVLKTFNLQDEKDLRHNWHTALQNSHFADSLRTSASAGDSNSEKDKSVSLTVTDVHFLLCLHIDAYYDRQSSVKRILDVDAKFPTAADNFFDFDPPHLTGTLAESILSRKLDNYAASMKEINEGEFAEVAPAALVKIVGGYYPVDFN